MYSCPLPSEKIREGAPSPIFSKGRGSAVHRLDKKSFHYCFCFILKTIYRKVDAIVILSGLRVNGSPAQSDLEVEILVQMES